MRPYVVNGKTYYPTTVSVGDTASGIASWYGPDFHGKKTSNGEIYNMHGMTAAHKTLPMNTMVKVTNLRNGKTAVVRINDRGPFVSGRIIDLTKAAASKIAMIGTGTAPVKLEIVGFYGQTNTSTGGSGKTSRAGVQKVRSVSSGNFLVQIGMFRNRAGAYAFKNQNSNVNGYQTTVREYSDDEGKFYRVYVVGFRSEDEARDFVAAKHFTGAFIVGDY